MMAPPASLVRFSDELEDLLIQFEDAWNRSAPGHLRDYCPPRPEPAFLLELVRIDVARRRHAGLAIDVEQYRRTFPELVDDQEASAQLTSIAEHSNAEATRSHSPSAETSVDLNSVTVSSAFGELRKHAQGGLGEVFVAEDLNLGRRVALKTLRAGRSGSRRARRDFLREAEVTSRLEHPGIVPVHGIGQSTDGRPCYSMRFVEGETLKNAIDRYHEAPVGDLTARALGFRDLLSRFVAVCNTVAYAHSRGVIHRDLKPENIMLGPFGETLVLDWGLAKQVTDTANNSATKVAHHENGMAKPSIAKKAEESDDATRTGDLIGTPAFMSPEQAAGDFRQMGPATDIFGLGATLYSILTGSPPYKEDSVAQVLTKARSGAFAPPGQRLRTIPAPLDAICQKAMAVEPGQRFASALDLARDLENWLADERVTAWKEPWHVGARRYARRHRTLVSVLIVLGIVLPIGFGIGAWIVADERAKRRIDQETAEIKEQAAAQTTDYLVKTFQSADPLGLDAMGFQGPGERHEDETIRRMLDGGADLLRDHMHDQPIRRAALLDAMGNSYRNLGDWDKAQRLLREGYDLRWTHLGVNAAETLASKHSLARLAQDRGEYADAAREYREIIRGLTFINPPQPLLAAQTKTHFAWMLFNQPFSLDRPQENKQNLAEADQLLQQALKAREENLPPNHRDIGLTLAALAAIKQLQGQDLAAGLFGARAIDVFRKSGNENSLGNLLLEYQEAERLRHRVTPPQFDEADKIYVRILAFARKHLGPAHPLTLVHMANMCGMYRQWHNDSKLHPIARSLVEGVRGIPAIRSMKIVVDAYIQYGDILKESSPDEAAKAYVEALRFARERPTENAENIRMLEQRLKTAKDTDEKK